MMGGFHGELDIVAIDTDGNGVLTRAELQARAVERLGPRRRERRRRPRPRGDRRDACPAPHGGFLNVFAEDPAERMADRLIALMGGTEAGRVEVAALAERRVNALLAIADADRDAALSPEEVEAAADRLDRPGPRHWHERGAARPRARRRRRRRPARVSATACAGAGWRAPRPSGQTARPAERVIVGPMTRQAEAGDESDAALLRRYARRRPGRGADADGAPRAAGVPAGAAHARGRHGGRGRDAGGDAQALAAGARLAGGPRRARRPGSTG